MKVKGKKSHKVFVATTTWGEDDPAVLKILSAAGMKVTVNPLRRRLSEEEIKDILKNGAYDGLLAGLEPLTRNVLEQAKELKVISRVGVGLDNVDMAAAKKLGIKVFNTPGVLTDAVAELTLGLMLAVLRQITLCDRKMRDGQWHKKMGALLKDKTVGIVGFGQIGQRVGQLVSAFGAKVIFTDVRKIRCQGMKQVTLAQLIKGADIISLHAAGKAVVIDDARIALMKPGVIVINTARGALIDENALVQGLASGKIAGAGLDVFWEEPYRGKLLEQEQVILTPHIGSYAKEARVVMERTAAENLIKGFRAS